MPSGNTRRCWSMHRRPADIAPPGCCWAIAATSCCSESALESPRIPAPRRHASRESYSSSRAAADWDPLPEVRTLDILRVRGVARVFSSPSGGEAGLLGVRRLPHVDRPQHPICSRPHGCIPAHPVEAGDGCLDGRHVLLLRYVTVSQRFVRVEFRRNSAGRVPRDDRRRPAPGRPGSRERCRTGQGCRDQAPSCECSRESAAATPVIDRQAPRHGSYPSDGIVAFFAELPPAQPRSQTCLLHAVLRSPQVPRPEIQVPDHSRDRRRVELVESLGVAHDPPSSGAIRARPAKGCRSRRDLRATSPGGS